MTSRERPSSATIDAYLAALAARLTVEPDERATILEEMRGHLEEATVAEAARGAHRGGCGGARGGGVRFSRDNRPLINSTLPVYWDMRRMLLGIVQGALAIWVIWTLATFPFVVHFAAQPQFDAFTSPAALLFTASPLGFGLFYTLVDGPWAALLMLALFGAIAFALGSRASSGWRAGFAFGLGVIVGMPFLPVSLLPLGQHFTPWANAVPGVLTIWGYALPFAVFAARLGARFAHTRNDRRMRVAAIIPTQRRRIRRATLVGILVFVALLGVNGWSFVHSLTPDPTSAARVAAHELATAQAKLPFVIRQPGYLPDGMALKRVLPAVSDCNPCVGYTVAILRYRDSHDNWIELTDSRTPCPSRQPTSTSPTPQVLSSVIIRWAGSARGKDRAGGDAHLERWCAGLHHEHEYADVPANARTDRHQYLTLMFSVASIQCIATRYKFADVPLTLASCAD